MIMLKTKTPLKNPLRRILEVIDDGRLGRLGGQSSLDGCLEIEKNIPYSTQQSGVFLDEHAPSPKHSYRTFFENWHRANYGSSFREERFADTGAGYVAYVPGGSSFISAIMGYALYELLKQEDTCKVTLISR